MMACRTTFFHIPLSLLLILIPCPPASLLSALCEVEEGLGMHEGCVPPRLVGHANFGWTLLVFLSYPGELASINVVRP